MIDEVQIFGVYVPAALWWAILASLLTYWLRPIFHRVPLDQVSWRPALLDITIFSLLWWGFSVLADAHVLASGFPI
ncbi:MAG: DUF1656 domain-containing protein [Proteobacteria bacterium]|nr:DUF1656 domain-containing protein [Pseudomonadota bacterium]